MAIDTTQGLPPTTGGTTSVAPNPQSQLGKDAFMKLLVSELKNQDPMNPMESRDMIAQLSTLTSVEKLNAIEEKLGALQGLQSSASAVQNAQLIGKNIEADTRSLSLRATEPASGNYELLNGASSVVIKVYDQAGNLLRKSDLGSQDAGAHSFAWDGKTDAGTRAPSGQYTFEVAAKSTDGQVVAASTRVSGLVSEVTYENGIAEVVVGGSRIPLGDITSIAQ